MLERGKSVPRATACLGALLFAIAPAASVAQSPLPLIPVPREVRNVGASSLRNGVQILCSGCTPGSSDQFTATDLAATFQSRNISTTAAGGFRIELRRLAAHSTVSGFSEEMKAEGYIITSSPSSLAVTAAAEEGLFYGAQTVKQLIEGDGPGATLHTADIRDWPAMAYRGISDDFARGPLPTVEFQKKQIRTIAAYKLNLYSLYFQHTMEYTAIPLMAPPGGTFTQAEARELVAYAAQYHVTIIPEQEAFGHLHYLLNWEQYAPLGETPHGDVLAPGQAEALKLTHGMFTELAGIYPGPFLHIGADETSELGTGQTKPQVDARGIGAVYLDYLQRIVTDLQPLHRKLLFWGDIAMHDPKLVKQLPDSFKRNTIAVAWEYNPHPTGYAPWITPFTNAHIETWVAPGINNWSRVYPNYNYGLFNMQQFTVQGQQLGATGQLNTIWDDDGETIASSNWYGILFGAEAAWHKGEASIPVFESSYGANFHGDLSGKIDQAQKELMAVHQLLNDSPLKSDGDDLLFWMDPWSVEGQRAAAQIRPILSSLRLHAERAIVLAAEARRANPNLREVDALEALELGARCMDLIGLKFQVSDEIAGQYAEAFRIQKHAERNLEEIQTKLQDISQTYSLLRDLYRDAWLKCQRPYFLNNNLERYSRAVQLWQQRADQINAVASQADDSQTIPAAASLGIPPAAR